MSEITKALAHRTDASERSLEASVDYARKLSASDLLPKSYQGKPQNVLLAIEHGRSLGIAPITAINMVHVISGKPSASAQLIGALVRRAGHTLRVKGDNQSATCKIIRSDDPEFEFAVTWTMERAKTAKLLANPTWASYPEAMLKARAITECARDACPEVLAGIAYVAEEIGGTYEVVAEQLATPEVEIADDGTAAPVTDDTPFDIEVVE